MQRTLRLKREVQMMNDHPPALISCWQDDSDTFNLKAHIRGSSETPYENGIFEIDVNLPERYPFEPPLVQFKTPIYHPNIDTSGRICLDILKMPPQGCWKPSLNVISVLTSVQLLMNEPNPDDPLMADIALEYKHSRPNFVEKAKRFTAKHAVKNLGKSGHVSSSSKTSTKDGITSKMESLKRLTESPDETVRLKKGRMM